MFYQVRVCVVCVWCVCGGCVRVWVCVVWGWQPAGSESGRGRRRRLARRGSCRPGPAASVCQPCLAPRLAPHLQRVVFDYSDLLVGPGNTAILERGIAEVARKYDMDWRVSLAAKQKRAALLVRWAAGRAGGRTEPSPGRRGRAGAGGCRCPCAPLESHGPPRLSPDRTPTHVHACASCPRSLQQAGPLPVRPADPGGERGAQLRHPNHHLQPPRWAARGTGGGHGGKAGVPAMCLPVSLYCRGALCRRAAVEQWQAAQAALAPPRGGLPACGAAPGACSLACTPALPLPPLWSCCADLEVVARRFGVPFRHLPITPKDPASKAAQEAQIDAILQEEGIDLIVLARYMQVRRSAGAAPRRPPRGRRPGSEPAGGALPAPACRCLRARR